MAYRKNQTNAQIVPLAIAGLEGETTTGNMSTANRNGRRYIGGTGSMPKAWARLISDRAEAGAVSQVIYSYSTPIAWLDAEHGWIIPNVTYSVTTSGKHQIHLWKLPDSRHITLPWDATPEDTRRVLDGRMYFGSDGRGGVTRPYPGPNYIAGE